MTQDPRLALEELLLAFRAHFDLANSDVDTESDEFLDAEERLSNAFFTYDDVMFTQLEVELPFEILDEDELFDEEEFEEETYDEDFDEDLSDDEDDNFVEVDD